MKRIGLLLLLVVLASGSVWVEIIEIPNPNLRAIISFLEILTEKNH
tara:strand:- start:777 stop:914 length:138 start_codon:yes stop_codon:yes gene_type:complete